MPSGTFLMSKLPSVAAASDVDLRVAGAQVGQGDPRLADRAAALGAGEPGLRHGLAVLAADVGQAGDRDALDLTGGRSAARGQPTAWVRTKPNWTAGHELGALGLLGVEAGVALLLPDVVVVTALEGGRLDPLVRLAGAGTGGVTVAA